MKKLLLFSLCLLPMVFSCGGKKENKEAPAPAPGQETIVPPGPSGHVGKPAQVRSEVNDALQMREEENERRLKEAQGQ